MAGENQRRGIARVEKQKDAERKERERQQHQDNVEIVRALNRVADQLATNEQQEAADHRKRTRREWLTIILIFATVLATGIGDRIFYVTMKDARRAAADAHSDSHETIVTNARAWLAPKALQLEDLPLKVDEPIRIRLIYQNLGRQPALNMVHNEKIDTMKLPPSGNWMDADFGFNESCIPLEKPREGQTIYPNIGLQLTAENYELHFRPPIKTDGPILMGLKTVYVQGCIAYETFGEWRYSLYCFYLEPIVGKPPEQWVFGICLSGQKAT